jgi:hypothetical protein
MPCSRLAVLFLCALPAAASCSGVCEGSLADVTRGCPATFDGTAAALPDCSFPPLVQSAWLCNDLIALSLSAGYASQSCYYDSSTHALVGGRRYSDVGSMCAGSSTSQAGRVSGATCAAGPAIFRNCGEPDAPDAGTTDAGDGGGAGDADAGDGDGGALD